MFCSHIPIKTWPVNLLFAKTHKKLRIFEFPNNIYFALTKIENLVILYEFLSAKHTLTLFGFETHINGILDAQIH